MPVQRASINRVAALLGLALFTHTVGALSSAKDGEEHEFDKVFDFMRAEVDSGFHRRTHKKKFSRMFKRMTAGTNPCDAELLSRGLMHEAGFGSRVNAFFDEVMVALYTGKSVAMCDHVNEKRFTNTTWVRYFRSSLPVCTSDEVCAANVQLPSMSLALLGRKLGHCLSRKTEGDRDYLLALRSFVASSVFRMKSRTREQIVEILKGSGIGEDDQYIGVHVRHGDKWQEAELLPTHTYGEAVYNYTNVRPSDAPGINRYAREHMYTRGTEAAKRDVAQKARRSLRKSRWEKEQLLSKLDQVSQEVRREESGLSATAEAIRGAARSRKVSKVYVASDDPRAYHELSARLPEFTVVQQPAVSTSSLEDRTYKDSDVILPLLIDVVALRRATLFMGTASSNIGQLVYYLREGEESFSLDRNGDWMDDRRCKPFDKPPTAEAD